MSKAERIQYDPETPYSFCQQCLKLAFTRKRKGQWVCAKCTQKIIEREHAFLAAKDALNAERKAPSNG